MQCPRSWQLLLSYETDRLHCYSGASHTGLISKSAVVSDVGLLAEDFTSVPGFQQVSLTLHPGELLWMERDYDVRASVEDSFEYNRTAGTMALLNEQISGKEPPPFGTTIMKSE